MMYVRILLSTTFLLFLAAEVNAEIPIVETWRYTFGKPNDGWEEADFNDGNWRKGKGGFGSQDAPGARIGTSWLTNDIWIRKSFRVDAVPAKPALMIHHNDHAEVYINGNKIASFEGHLKEYRIVPLDESQRAVLKTGHNVMAVHCHELGGTQFIDVHLIDAEDVPSLPKPKRNTSPFRSELTTTWGENVSAENAWTEYPRPQLVREQWQNLNGHWNYAITRIEQEKTPTQWKGEILVPYPLESKLSGVQRLLDASEALWYQRKFRSPKTAGKRTLLNFEAVDYHCTVFINGEAVGSHQGGNTPFVFDITNALREGENELTVRVEDATEGWQLRGKQVLHPRGIWYTQISGIWQTVWLEEVADQYIKDLKITTDANAGTIKVRADLTSGEPLRTIVLVVKDGERIVGTAQGQAGELTVQVKNPKLWSPDSPHLYQLEMTLSDVQGLVSDRVTSYAGIRTVGKVRDKQGRLRFTLNGTELFHWGPLDQGWWPDGLLTPPSDEAMLFDIEFLKSAGFNMIRKHIKVEPRRYYYHCDRLGMMVWQDQVSAGHNAKWTRLIPYPIDAIWPDAHHKQFMLEFERMIAALENHPAIVVWVPFNEAWGQHRTLAVGRWASKRDPSRHINVASGGNFWPAGDIVDHHSYPYPEFPFEPNLYDEFIRVVGEFGGHGFPVQGHLWDANRRNWGYGDLPKNKSEYKERYITSLDRLNQLRGEGIAAGIYTQTTDVEGEINGLLTYDRKVIKIPAKELAELHKRLFEPVPERRDAENIDGSMDR